MNSKSKLTTEQIQEFIAQKKAERLAHASKRITPNQGLYIKYRLKCIGVLGGEIAMECGCSQQAVSNVLSGKSHSQRIERAVAQRLGYSSWNDMVQCLREMAA